MPEDNKYNLEERTAKFGEEIIGFIKNIERNPINTPILVQLIRSGTSIGANYYEANGASSERDFKNKIFICKKETKEIKYWLRMVAKISPEAKDKAKNLWQEAQELTLIFSKIVSTMEKKKNDKNKN